MNDACKVSYLRYADDFPLVRIINKVQYIRAKAHHRKLCGQEVYDATGGREVYLDTLEVLIESFEQRYFISSDPSAKKAGNGPKDILKRLLQERCMTQESLANALSVSPATVCQILSGKRGFSEATIKRLSEFFKVPHTTFRKPEC